MNNHKTNILIVGAGHGGTALVELFRESSTVNIVGVVDIDPGAPGMKVSRELGIPTAADYKVFLKGHEMDEIVNVTGSEKVQKELVEARPEGVEVIGGHSAELMWRLVEERRRFERALRGSEEGYRTLVEGANQPIFKVSREGRIIFLNRYSAGTLGGKPEDYIGKTMWDIFPGEIADAQMASVTEAIRSGERLIKVTETVVRGETRYYEAVLQPMQDASDEVDSCLVIALDITDRKKAEEGLSTLNKTLLSLGTDFEENVRTVTEACGQMLGGDCALYNRLSDGVLYACGQWQAPPDLKKEDDPEGHICLDVIQKCKEGTPFIVKDLPNTSYFRTDPNVKKYGLKTYIGYPVCRLGECVGSLCVVYTRDAVFTDNDKRVLGILADALSREEDRKNFLEAVRQSEEKYRLITENTSDIIAIMKFDGTYLYASPSHRQLGYEPEEILEKNGLDFIHPDDKMRLLPLLKKYAEVKIKELTGRNSTIAEVYEHIEFRVPKKSGEWRYMESTANLMKSPSEEGTVILIVSRDVTERKNAEKALLASEEKIRESRDYLEKIINSIADPIFVKNKDHTWIMLNDAYCKFMGYPREELIGKSDHDYFPREEADVFWSKDEVVFESGEENINEEKFTDAQGVQHTIITKKTLYTDAEGEKILVGIIRDITERKTAEEAMQRQGELLNNIISTVPYYVFWKDREYVYLGCNDNFAKASGLDKPEDIIGKRDADLSWQAEEADFSTKCDEEVIKNNFPMLNIEEERHLADGTTATFLTSRVPLRDTEGNVVGILGVHADISERKHMEEVLRESEAMYRTLFENTGSSMMLINEDMTIAKINAELENFSGFSKKEVEGKRTVLDFISDEEKDKVREYARIRRIDPEAAPRNYETKFLDKKGEESDVYVTVAVIPGTKRSVASILDITELKRNEAQLKKQKDLLDNVNKALEHKLAELESAMGHIKKLEGLVPICAGCKKMRVEGADPKDPKAWVPLERYISDRTDASFTHGLCPDCVKRMYGNVGKKGK